MIVYWDGGDHAFATTVYVRWKLQSGGYQTCLLVVKARMSALWGFSTPRVELNGAVLATRLAFRAIRSMETTDVPELVYFLGD